MVEQHAAPTGWGLVGNCGQGRFVFRFQRPPLRHSAAAQQVAATICTALLEIRKNKRFAIIQVGNNHLGRRGQLRCPH